MSCFGRRWLWIVLVEGESISGRSVEAERYVWFRNHELLMECKIGNEVIRAEEIETLSYVCYSEILVI